MVSLLCLGGRLAKEKRCSSADRTYLATVRRQAAQADYFDKDETPYQAFLSKATNHVVQHEIDHLNGNHVYDRILARKDPFAKL